MPIYSPKIESDPFTQAHGYDLLDRRHPFIIFIDNTWSWYRGFMRTVQYHDSISEMVLAAYLNPFLVVGSVVIGIRIMSQAKVVGFSAIWGVIASILLHYLFGFKIGNSFMIAHILASVILGYSTHYCYHRYKKAEKAS
ncbi:hypothetical protein Dalk_2808 [Desulfatibacillum aliphaticivorans]|uniref:Uncharacterized protein n=1 Tax=Desulfatibacillum aliphaticivorans TaxID=218208 RepID=B8FKX7_DESAL|nr:hypothetical protein [Desulfatibacillum aliphaticivorans]ACL04499.1 hypothetical protein Dalk_2808 [Desulfatibacillum aliphaticivorans]